MPVSAHLALARGGWGAWLVALAARAWWWRIRARVGTVPCDCLFGKTAQGQCRMKGTLQPPDL